MESWGSFRFASIDFKSDWVGFNRAMLFVKSFKAKNCEKMEYYVDKNR